MVVFYSIKFKRRAHDEREISIRYYEVHTRTNYMRPLTCLDYS